MMMAELVLNTTNLRMAIHEVSSLNLYTRKGRLDQGCSCTRGCFGCYVVAYEDSCAFNMDYWYIAQAQLRRRLID